MPTPNVPTVAPTMEEHKAAALQQLRALRSYDVDTLKKQEIVKGLVSKGFDVNDPIEAIDHQEIRLLDLAFKEMDYDFARFLVERGANPCLCVEAAWFIDEMQELFDLTSSNVVIAAPATSDVATQKKMQEPELTQVTEHYKWRFEQWAADKKQVRMAPDTYKHKYPSCTKQVKRFIEAYAKCLALAPEGEWNGLIRAECEVWLSKFGFLDEDFARVLVQVLKKALYKGNKELVFSYCAMIDVVASHMTVRDCDFLLESLHKAVHGHALGVLGTWWASGYQRLCHEDPTFYIEFKDLKVQLRILLNEYGEKWTVPLTSAERENELPHATGRFSASLRDAKENKERYAIARYNLLLSVVEGAIEGAIYLRSDLVRMHFENFIIAYAERLSVAQNENLFELAGNEYQTWSRRLCANPTRFSKWVDRTLPLAYLRACCGANDKLVVSYIALVRVMASNLEKRSLYALWSSAKDTLDYYPNGRSALYSTELRAMEQQLSTLLDGWQPPPPPPSESSGGLQM